MNAMQEMVKGWKFGIFDTQQNDWLQDCFDNPHGFSTMKVAHEYLSLLKESSTCEIRPLPNGLYGGEA